MKIEGIIYRLKKIKTTSKSQFKILFNFILILFKDLFYNNLPSDDIKDLPSFNIFTLGLLIYITSLIIFLFFIIFSYINDRNSFFLAVSKNSGDCYTVSKKVSGVFLVDYNGEWEGSDKFIYSQAIYSFTLPNYRGDLSEYQYMVSRALSQAEKLGQIAYKNNLGINILSWTVFSSTIRLGGSANTFAMSGSPKAVFDRRIYSASFGSRNGQCPFRPTVNYNTESAQLSLEVNYNDFMSSTLCTDVINPAHFGYIDYYSGNNLKLTIDSRSALTALAINYQLLSIDELEMIPGTEFTFQTPDNTFSIAQYFYPRYPGMRPLVCFVNPNIQLVCGLQIYETYLYPLFNHVGNNPTKPVYCDCNYPELIDGGCHFFYFVSSFVIFDYNETLGETPSDAVDRLVKFSIHTTGDIINRNSFNTSFYTVLKPSILNSSMDLYKKSFDFCQVDSSYCTILSIFMTDGFELSSDGMVYNPSNEYTISENYYQLRQGSCNDTFTIPISSQLKLLNNPPVPLEEPYYECRSSKSSAILNAWGVSSANMSTVLPIIVMLTLTLFFTYSKLKFIPIPKTYTSTEKTSVLDYLAFHLLLIRDKRYQYQLTNNLKDIEIKSNHEQNQSILMNLFNELSQHEKIPKFFHEKNEHSINNSINNSTNNSINDDVINETPGLMMSNINSSSTNNNNNNKSIDELSIRNQMFSVDSLITESQYDQLDNPLYIPPSQKDINN